MSHLKRPLFRVTVTASMMCFHLLALTHPFAAPTTWTAGSDDNNNWADGSNWDTLVAPTLVDDVFFVSPIPNTAPLLNPEIIVLANGSLANQITFNDSYLLSGGSVELGSGLMDVNFLDTVSVDSLLTGTAGFNKAGRGTLWLTNASNNYTGVTTVSNGTLIISDEAQLGASTDAVIITGNTSVGNGGGNLLLLSGWDSTLEFERDLNISGGGSNNFGSALTTVGNVHLTGDIQTSASGGQDTRIASNFGNLQISGTLTISQGTTRSLTTQGAGNIMVDGLVTGIGGITKTGIGGMTLTNVNNDFTGTVRVDTGSLRVSSSAVIGTSTAVASIGLNGGIFEIRSDAPDFQNKNIQLAGSSSTVFVDRAINGSGLNVEVDMGNFSFGGSNRNLTLGGRNGYTVHLTGLDGEMGGGGGNQTTLTNNARLATLDANLWKNSDSTARVLTLTGTGNTIVTGGILATGGAHVLTKGGTGTLTILGNSNYTGATNTSGGALLISGFGSLGANPGSSTAAVNIGSTTTTAGILTYLGQPGTGAGETTTRTINLNGTSAAVTLNADQAGTAPSALIFTSNFTATGLGNKILTLGGTNKLDNEIRGAIPNSTGFTTSLQKSGVGTWNLSGTNTYTGTTTITDGVLKVRANAASSTIIQDASAILFNVDTLTQAAGGTLEFVGRDAQNNIETLGALTPTAGAGTILLTPGAGGTASLVFSSYAGATNGAGYGLNIVGSDASNKVTLTGVATGLVSPNVYFDSSHFAYSDGGVLRAPVYGTDANFVTSATALTTGVNNEITGSFNADAVTISTLRINGAHTLTLNASQTLTINVGGANTAGGILATGGNSTITGGTGITTGGAGALVVRVDGEVDKLTIASILTSGTSGGLTKNGLGTLVLSAVNAQTGDTHINEGTLQLSGSSSRISGASAALNIRQGATLDLNGVNSGTAIGIFNGAGTVTNSAATTTAILTVGNGNGIGNFTGLIEDGAGKISVFKTGSGSQTWSGLNTYTGSTTIASTGVVSVAYLADIGEASGIGMGDADNNAQSLIFTGSTGGLSYTGLESISIDREFTLGGTGARIQSNGQNNATLIWNSTSALTFGTGITAAQLLTLGGASIGDNQFDLRIINNTNGGAATSVTKADAGLWILGNQSNSYSGSTTISGGALRAIDGGSLPTTSALVLGGGVLETHGTFDRALASSATAGSVHWSAGGGFAASTDRLLVAIGGTASPTDLTWGSGGFMTSGSLVLSSTTALFDVEMVNNINLNGAVRTISVSDNTSTAFDFATLSGDISGTGTSGITKSGNGRLQLLGANTYEGNTSISAGALVVTSVGGSGMASSSLGAGTGALSIGSGTTAGTLIYVGSGETSDRLINMAGTASSTTSPGGTTIESSGTGALILRNVVNSGNYIAARTKTLTLQGQNTDANEISSNLANFDGPLAVTKTGGGTWILSGNNIGMTGTVSVSAGALGIGHDNAMGSGNLTVSNSYLFAQGGDRMLTNTAIFTVAGNTVASFIGEHSISIDATTSILFGSSSGSSTITNNLIEGEKLTLDAPVMRNNDSGSARTMTFNGSGYTIVNANITDNPSSTVRASNITYSGTGTLELNGNNSHSGPTTISNAAAKVILGTDSAFGTGNAILTTGTLFSNGTDRTIANNVTHGGTFAIDGEDKFTFNGMWLNSGGNRTLTVNTTGGVELAGEVRLSESTGTTARTLTLNGTGDVLISGVISNGTGTGNSAFSYTGTGTLTLNGVNTHSGNTTISNAAAKVILGTDSAFGTGTALLTTGTLFSNGTDRTIANNVTHGGTFIIAGDDKITFNGMWLNSAASRTLTVNTTGEGVVLAGEVRLSESTTTTARTLTLNGTGDVLISGLVTNGLSSGASALAYSGSGTLTLTAANTYTGTTTLNNNNGTLRLTGAGKLSTGNLTVTAGSLFIEGADQSVATLTMGNSAGTSALIDVGAGRTLKATAITYSGTTTLAATITGDGTLDLGTSGITVSVADNAALDADMIWSIDNLIGSGVFTKTGNGTLDLSGIANNDFDGTFTVSAGAIMGLGALDNNLLLNGGVYQSSGTFTRSLGAGDNQVQWTTTTAGGGFAAAGGPLTVTLGGVATPLSLTWGEQFFVQSGAPLIFGSVTANDVVTFTNDINLAGAERTFSVADNTSSTADKAVISGVLSNGGITKTGNGALELAGDNTFEGAITVSAGTLQFSTVSDNGGGPSNLGQGTNGITLSGGRLQFIGGADQETDRGITFTTTGILDASGTGGATITYTGVFNPGVNSLNLEGTGYGIFAGEFVQTSNTGDLNKNGTGTWRMDSATTIVDNLVITSGELIFNVANAFTGDDLFIRDALLTLTVNGALTTDVDDFNISTETASGGILDIHGTTGSTVTEILIGRTAANNVSSPDLSGSIIDSVGGGSFGATTMSIRNGVVEVDIAISGTTNLGATISADNGGLNYGSGSITGSLSQGGSLVLNNGSISGDITFGSGSTLTKNSVNTVTLSGDNTVTGAGISTINNGILVLDYTDNTGAKISAAGLTMNGGTLQIDGHASTAVTTNAGNLTLGSSTDPAPAVVRINTAGAAATLQVGSITRNLGATLRFNPSTTLGSLVTTAENGAGDILGGWATYQLGNGSAVFATIIDDKITGFDSTVINDVAMWTAGADITESTGFTGTLASSLSINSLRFDAASGSTVTVGADETLNIASGGILITSNVSGTAGISGGFISSGTNELIITHDGTADFNLTSRMNGTLALTKAGSGTLVLDSATNTSNGTLRLSGGTVRLQGGNALGDRAAVIMEATTGVVLDVVDSETIGALSGGSSTNYKNMQVNIANGETLTINQIAGGTFYGNINATSGSATLTRIGASTLVITDGFLNLGPQGVVNVSGGRLTIDINGNNNQLTQVPSGTTVNVSDGGSFFIEHHGITVNTGTPGRVANDVPFFLNSGGSTTDSLFYRHDQADDHIEQIGVVTFGSGVSSVRVDATSSDAAALSVLRASSIVRQNQATMVLRGLGTQNTTGRRGQFQSAAAFTGYGTGTTTSLPVIPWAIGSSAGGTVAADSFLTTTGGANATWRPLNLSTEYLNVTNAVTWDAVTNTQNVLVSASTTAAAGNKALRALLISTGTGIVDLTGDGTGPLTVESGGFLFSGTGSSTLSGFTGINVSPTAGEYVFHVMGSSASIDSALTTTGANLTKSGPGTLILTASNLGLDSVAINEGVLQISDLDNIGGNGGDLLFANGTLLLDAAYSGDDLSARSIAFLSGVATLDTNGHDLALANSIGNGGAGSFTKTGNGILTLNAAASYGGTTTITGGTLRYGVDNALPTSSNVVLNLSTLDMGSFDATLGGLTLTANATLYAEGDVIFDGMLTTSTSAASRTLTVNGGGNVTINGNALITDSTSGRTLNIAVNDSGSVVLNGSFLNGTPSTSSLAKFGNGSLELTQRNFYTGNTSLGNSTNLGGTLKLSGAATLGAGTLTVSNGTLLLEGTVSRHAVTTLTTGGGPAGGSTLIRIGDGVTLAPTAITFSSTGSNLTTIIDGDGTLDLGTSGITVNIGNSSAAEVDMSWEMDTVIGSGLFTKAGTGTLDIRGVTNYNFNGTYQINAGAILGLDTTGNLILNGGVFEGSGDFTRSLGTGNNQVQWAAGTAGGGFAAQGDTLYVNIGGTNTDGVPDLPPSTLVWGSTQYFVSDGAPLIFGSLTANDVVNFQNNIDLNGGTRTVTVTDNTTATTDKAVISGVISNGSLTKTGNGILELSGANTFSNVRVTTGILQFSTVTDVSGAASNLGQGTITLSGGNLQFIGAASQSTNRPISFTGTSSMSSFGTNDAVITYSGAINGTAAFALNLTGNATSSGVISGGITQTGTSADVDVNSGTWTLSGALSTLADDLRVTNTGSVLNLGTTGSLSFTSGSSNYIYARNGGQVNFLTDDVTSTAQGIDGLLIGYETAGVAGILNMNTFNITVPRVDLGQTGAGLEGLITGNGGTITVNTSLNLYRGTIEGINLTGTANTVKNGAGEVILKSNNTGLSGTTTLTNGLLRLDYTDSNTQKIGSGLLTFNGGTLIMDGHETLSFTETVNGVTLGSTAGAASIQINNVGSQQLTFDMGAVTRLVLGTTMSFEASSANAIFVTTSENPDGFTSLGGWASYSRRAFASVDVNGNIVAATTVLKDDVSTWLAGDNVSDASGYTGIVETGSINSLVFNSANASNLVLGSDANLTLTSGGILIAEGAASASISGGVISSGLPVTDSTILTELIVHQHSSNGFTLASLVNGNLALTKSGAGTMILNGDNLYTGQTTINEGVLSISGGKAIGDRSIVTLRNRTGALLDLNNSSETIAGLAGGGADGGRVNIGTGTLTLLNNSGTTPVFTGTLEGSGTFIKNGANTQEMEGNSTLFTGNVIVNQGLLHLDSTSGILVNAASFTINGAGTVLSDQEGDNDTDRIGNSASVTLNYTAGSNGLRIRNDNDEGEIRNETIGSLVLGAGHNVIMVEANNAAANTAARLTAADLVRNNKATVLVRGLSLGAASGRRGLVTFGTLPSGAIGGTGAGGTDRSIYPYMVGDASSSTALGNSFVTYDTGSSSLRPLLTTEYIQNEAGYNALAASTQNNVRFSASTLAALTGGSKTINSLVLDSSTAAVTVTGGAADVLTLSSGALLAATTTAANGMTLNGFSELRTATDEYIMYVTNATSSLTVTPSLTTSNASLTKSGAGLLILSNASTYTGGTWFNQGFIEVSALDRLGSGGLNFFSGGLRWATGSTFDPTVRDMMLGLGGGVFDTNGNNVTFANAFGSGGAGGLSKLGNGTLTLNAAGDFTGPASITAGTLTYGVANALPSGTDLTLAGGILNIGSFDTVLGNLEFTGSATITGSADLLFTGNFNQSTGSRTLTVTNTGVTTFDGDILSIANASTTVRTLGLAVGTGAKVVINNQITNGSAVGSLSKTGSGLLVLTSDNFYTGNTAVSAGGLLANNPSSFASATGSGNVTVSAGAFLGGTGRISGGVTTTGRITPGSMDALGVSTIGQLTVGTLTANTGSELFFQIGGATVIDTDAVAAYQANPGTFVIPSDWTDSYDSTTKHDQINITGTGVQTINATLTISGDFLNGYVPDYGAVFHLVDWASIDDSGAAGTLAGTHGFLNLPDLGVGRSWNTSYFSSHGIVFVIPEPSRMFLLFFGLFGLFFRRRR
ncbi:putative secreted protein with PEP-CTERM sorting signal [Prosthecobacter fusiformis]|uniref:Putative secreted protein with PEP-CTERM sorting signal n=1 Tax=Prosthecobacter fusiformis TaxID=48464 RepID=A0A4R7RIU8_9BACT|nr:autotransporter-associated beta strand repeat-containing protein [Prosthecobacter fusiformis]TDU64028.1 putative secreted protein with PEP-CTERM sorting signal [Prosthecobacter fusiformis]